MRRFCIGILGLVLMTAVASGAEPKPAAERSPARREEQEPALTFEQLSFAEDKLQRQVERFHARGEKLAQPNGKKNLYQRARSTPQSQWSEYTAWWQSHEHQNFLASRDYRDLSITVEGPRRDGVDRLIGVRVRGRATSKAGWVAEVEYGVNPRTQGANPGVSAIVGHARGAARSPFDVRSGAQVIQLSQPSVSVSAKQSSQLQYRFHHTHESQRDFAATLDLLYGEPETLRDKLLADVEELRQQATKNLGSDFHVRIYDARGATSAEPPREQPIGDNSQPTAATRKALADEVEKQLTALETTFRDDFREIHAVVQQALPLRELLEPEALTR